MSGYIGKSLDSDPDPNLNINVKYMYTVQVHYALRPIILYKYVLCFFCLNQIFF